MEQTTANGDKMNIETSILQPYHNSIQKVKVEPSPNEMSDIKIDICENEVASLYC